jgi:hypothetical protein
MCCCCMRYRITAMHATPKHAYLHVLRAPKRAAHYLFGKLFFSVPPCLIPMMQKNNEECHHVPITPSHSSRNLSFRMHDVWVCMAFLMFLFPLCIRVVWTCCWQDALCVQQRWIIRICVCVCVCACVPVHACAYACVHMCVFLFM